MVVAPPSASVLLGNQVVFTAAVHNSTDTAVTWSVNGTVGGAADVGTITGAGVYNAPVDLPVPATLQVTATSHANAAKSGSAAVTIQSDVAITLPSGENGGDTVELGATRAPTEACLAGFGRAPRRQHNGRRRRRQDLRRGVIPRSIHRPAQQWARGPGHAPQHGRIRMSAARNIASCAGQCAGTRDCNICGHADAAAGIKSQHHAGVRQPANISGGSACPVRSHIRAAAAARAVQCSTALGTDPLTVITLDQTPSGRIAELGQPITQSIAVWSGVSGTTLQSIPATVTTTAVQNACGSDGVNSICFGQADLAFTPGVLAFSRVITADRIGVQLGSGTPSAEIGEILDADVYFNPSDPHTTYATPAALSSTPAAYDLESLLTHELGHTLGFSHSAVWSAMMFPFAPTPGTFSGTRPSAGQADAPLGEDDRTGLRVLYPDAGDVGSHRFDSRADRERQSIIAAVVAAGRHRSLRLAGGCGGCGHRRNRGRCGWRMELQRRWSHAI